MLSSLGFHLKIQSIDIMQLLPIIRKVSSSFSLFYIYITILKYLERSLLCLIPTTRSMYFKKNELSGSGRLVLLLSRGRTLHCGILVMHSNCVAKPFCSFFLVMALLEEVAWKDDKVGHNRLDAVIAAASLPLSCGGNIFLLNSMRNSTCAHYIGVPQSSQVNDNMFSTL